MIELSSNELKTEIPKESIPNTSPTLLCFLNDVIWDLSIKNISSLES